MGIVQDFKQFIRIKGAWYLLLGLFLYGIGSGILAPMNAIYLSDAIGLSKVQIAIIFSATALLNITITLSVGLFSDKMEKKKLLPIVALALCMVGLLFYMQAETFTQALIGMVIAIAPSGLIMGQFYAMARNHFMSLAPKIYEIAQIWLRAMMSIGFFTGLLLGANIYLLFNFKGVLVGNLIGYFSLFLLLILYKEYKPVESIHEEVKGETFSWIMLIALLMLSCADALRGLYLPLVVVELFEKPQMVSYIWSVQAVFELLFMTMAGYWALKFGTKKVILLSSFCALLTYLLYSTGPPLVVFFLIQPVYSFFVSVLLGVSIGYVQRMFHTKIGLGSSVYVILFQIASLIGYMLPFIIEGYNPKIFIIPAVLVSLSIVLMIGYLSKERTRLQAV